VVKAARAADITLKRTLAREGKELKRRACGYAHAKQFRRLRRVLERQCTVLGIVMREVERKRTTATTESPTALMRLNTALEHGRTDRLRRQPWPLGLAASAG
jgi:IS5 family transposase